MKRVQRSPYKTNRLFARLIIAATALIAANAAYANAGFGTNTNVAGQAIAVPTYFASSPQGWEPALDANHMPVINPATGNPYTATEAFAANGNVVPGTVVPMINTGTAIRKFVEPLHGAYNGLDGSSTLGTAPAFAPGAPYATETSMGLPVGITESWLDHGGKAADDYYEIAIVEYLDQMHPDLANPTRLRGYVQIETPNILAKGLTDITGVVGSEHIKATYLDGTPILDASGNQVYFVHAPHYLGPVLLAAHGQPIRIVMHNYLPYTDAAGGKHGYVQPFTDAAGVSHLSGNGDLSGQMAIPVDTYLAGGGPINDANGAQITDPITGKPMQFSQNRISTHWHGGDSPWTNDGTPHEWFAPAGDVSYSVGVDARHPRGLGQGEAFQNVPDMPDYGPGTQTMYFPNNLSGRLMMYHDHASGITRINAYEGVAAGYVVYDNTELTLAASTLGTTLTATSGGLPTGLLDAVGIPLVVQDKGFLPKNIGPNDPVNNPSAQGQSQDAKWDLAHWGQEGDFFFPHVYEVNQDPNSIDGTNPVGRWDWGPWFWPVFPAQYSLPSGNYGDVTTTPEAFMDTPIVNGQLYPTMTVDPKTYRFRILSIANDRTFNLGLYEAVDGAGKVCDAAVGAPVANPTAPGQTTAPATCTEVAMVPASVPASTALSTATGLPLVAAFASHPNYPLDGRAGGVPDPTTSGPDIVQIGNEGGLLPAPAIWPAQPVTYDQSVRSMTVYNVLHHQLFLGGAERADVFIDFSQYAGKTLILYNDAPAPSPGFDPRIDYFTGVGDQTQGGGAYDTLPGYGPNTRTVMQIKVNATNTSGVGGALNVATLQQALPVAYAATQPAPIVPESAYNTVFNTNNGDNYARIYTGSATAPNFEWTNPAVVNLGVLDTVTSSATYGKIIPGSGINVLTGGAGYTSAPTVTIKGTLIPGRGGVGQDAQATATVVGGVLAGITVTNLGTGYDATKPLTVTLTGGTPTTAATVGIQTNNHQVVHVINKAIQELFDPVYGRMNATLAVELPFSSATVATTIPLAYIDAPADDPVNILNNFDAIDDGETQIWKITHNGVDSHPVHFHLVNVQVINRVDWAGVVKPPEANEIGWKETLRMNPLEDVYVAVKAVRPVLPFGVPRSQRALDPSQAVGSQLGFTQIDMLTGNAPTYQNQIIPGTSPQTVVAAPGYPPVQVWNLPVATTAYSNQLTDFDNEYVWHCHILGHEEFDFMRPFIFHPAMATPDAPGAVTLNGSTITWTDPTPFGGQDAQGIPTAGLNANGVKVSSPKNEVGFKVQETVYTNAITQTPKMVYTLPASHTATITNGGTGYTAAPVVAIYGGTWVGGTTWTISATVRNGAVTGITWTGNPVFSATAGKPYIYIAPPDAGTAASAVFNPALVASIWTINGVVQYNPPTTSTTAKTTVFATVPANTTSWTDTTGKLLPAGTVTLSTSTNPVTKVITTATVTTTPEVVAFNSAGNSVPGSAATAAVGSAINSGAVTGATAAANAAAAAAAAATTAATAAATATANAATAAAATAAANTAANAAVAAAAAQSPVAFAAGPGLTTGSVSLIWANNPLNVVAATGYTNVTGYTLSWSGTSAGTLTSGLTGGVTVEGLTSGSSYNFSLVANAPAGISPTVTATAAAK